MKFDKKNIITLAVLVVGLFGVVHIGAKNNSQQIDIETLRVLNAEELLKIPSDSEDKGIITKYNVPSQNTFEFTYINDNGKVKMVKLKDLYIINQVEKMEGSSFVKKVINKNSLTEDQIQIVARSLTDSKESAEMMIESLGNGDDVVVGFVIGNEKVEEGSEKEVKENNDESVEVE